MAPLAKRYVLVEEDAYARHLANDKLRTDSKRINPFTNPDVVATKRKRNELADAVTKTGVDVDDAALLLQKLVQQYTSTFAKVRGSRTSRQKREVPTLANRAKKDKLVEPTPSTDARESAPLAGDVKKLEEKTTRPKSLPLKKEKKERVLPTFLPKDPSLRPKYDKEKITKTLGGGYLSDADARKAALLMHELKEAKLVTPTDRLKSVTIDGNRVTGRKLGARIRDLLFNPEGHREQGERDASKLKEFLNDKGVKFD